MIKSDTRIHHIELLLTLDYLLNYTNEEHPATQQDICRHATNYGLKYDSNAKQGNDVRRQRIGECLKFLKEVCDTFPDKVPFILEKTINDFVSDDNKNVFDSVKNKEILEKVYDVLNSIMNSKIINKNKEFYLHYNDNNTEIKLQNLSAGLKSFVIIKRLLENGSLNEKDVLILDEPEIHLHPKWQLIYAELIVLLQKYFNLTITITTHSHYFLEAINRYSKKHNIDERVNFYITELSENQSNVIFKNVNDNLDIIYEKMYEPLEILSNMREEQDNEKNNP